ncbi:hypothetical protein [Streptomyces sp. NPDC002403]
MTKERVLGRTAAWAVGVLDDGDGVPIAAVTSFCRPAEKTHCECPASDV